MFDIGQMQTVVCFLREETAGAVWGGPQHPARVGHSGHPPHLLQLQPTGRLPYLVTLGPH